MPSDLRVLHLDRALDIRRQPDAVLLRPIETSDRAVLAALYRDSYPPDIGAEDLQAAQAQMDATFAGEYGELRPDASLIAFLDGTPAGAIMTTCRSIWDPGLAGPLVIDLFVHPTARGRGVGRALLQSVIRICCVSGDSTLALRVGAGTSPDAAALYDAVGFVDPTQLAIGISSSRDPRAVRRILEDLPDWFGSAEAIDNYEADAADERFASRLAISDARVVGVALVARHFPEAAELHLIAVSPELRGRGVGQQLIERIARDLGRDGCRFLTVHTVGPSFEHKPYAQTRAFYRALGFARLEEHVGLDWPGPTVILVRPLCARDDGGHDLCRSSEHHRC